MKSSRVAVTICQELERNGMKYVDLAKAAGITHGALSQLVSKGFRLAPNTLRQLSHCWPVLLSNHRVLVAHLLDEIGRAGHASSDWKIEHREHKHGSAFADNMEFVRRAAQHIPAIVDLIGNLAEIARAELPEDMLEKNENIKKFIAAEDHAAYDAPKRSKP